MKKPPARKPAKNYKTLSDRLIKLLFALKHDPRSGFVDMSMRSKAGAELDALLKREARFEWRKVGATEHLFDLSTNPPSSLAYVIQLSPRKVEWHILGRKAASGGDKSMRGAKAEIEFYFETIQSEE